jgi:hypothetical protein
MPPALEKSSMRFCEYDTTQFNELHFFFDNLLGVILLLILLSSNFFSNLAHM